MKKIFTPLGENFCFLVSSCLQRSNNTSKCASSVGSALHLATYLLSDLEYYPGGVKSGDWETRVVGEGNEYGVVLAPDDVDVSSSLSIGCGSTYSSRARFLCIKKCNQPGRHYYTDYAHANYWADPYPDPSSTSSRAWRRGCTRISRR